MAEKSDRGARPSSGPVIDGEGNGKYLSMIDIMVASTFKR
jgi:hypothetical protein